MNLIETSLTVLFYTLVFMMGWRYLSYEVAVLAGIVFIVYLLIEVLER